MAERSLEGTKKKERTFKMRLIFKLILYIYSMCMEWVVQSAFIEVYIYTLKKEKIKTDSEL